MKNAYASGANFERKVEDYLMRQGYFCRRSPGSKGRKSKDERMNELDAKQSVVDIIAIKKLSNSILLLYIQCKVKGVIGKREWDTLLEVATEYGAVPILAQRGARRGPYEVIPDMRVILAPKVPYARQQPERAWEGK